MSGTDDAELGKGRDQYLKDRLHDHMGVTPGDVQEGADGAFRRAVRAHDALSNSLTTRCAASHLHGVHVHDSRTFLESIRGCAPFNVYRQERRSAERIARRRGFWAALEGRCGDGVQFCRIVVLWCFDVLSRPR
jgi:hypothetical protein